MSLFKPMRLRLDEESIEYSVGETVLVGLTTDKGVVYVKGKIEERLGKYLYKVNAGSGILERMYMEPLFLKKIKQ